METSPTALSAGHPVWQVQFVYDWQGRRIARHVWRGAGGPQSWTVKSDRWLYDGWNVVAEFSAPDPASVNLTRSKTYTWGLDLSGTLQGAGGVGGLLSVTSHSALLTSHYPSYDGNGNIIAWTQNDANVPTARREYDAFGNTLISEGSAPCDFGFSTKMREDVTGLYYYGYRFYDPVMGRWPSRDPIEESGGINLYGFVGNDGVNRWDYLGMAVKPIYKMSIAGATPFWQRANNPFQYEVMYRSLSWRKARRDILNYFDDNNDGRLNEKDCPPFRIKILGYIWGGWSSLILVHKLAEIADNPNKNYKIAVGTLDPVNTLRGEQGIAAQVIPQYVVKGYNIYQRNGMRVPEGLNWILSPHFKGEFVEGAEGIDPGGIQDVTDQKLGDPRQIDANGNWMFLPVDHVTITIHGIPEKLKQLVEGVKL